jgi:DNA repair exonuclease SbcCD ATPase subunit
MIILNSLSIKNFICIEDANFDFSKNYITAFYGANGSGKSAVFEALALCWTERRRGDSYKDFIKRRTDYAEITHTATFRGDPIRFEIKIEDKKGATTLQRKITYRGHEYNNSECTTLLASFDIDYLQHIMFSMQGENNITDLRPGERTKLLKRIFNFEFESQIEQLDNLIKQEAQNMLVLKTQVDVISHAKFDYEKEEPTFALEELAKIGSRIKEIEETIRKQEENQLLQAETHRRLDGLRAQCTAAITRKHTIETDIASLNSSRDRLHSDKTKHNAALALLADPESVKAEIQERTADIESFTRLVALNKVAIEEKITSLDERTRKILELNNHIEAHKEGKCPKCGQATHPESVPSLEGSRAALQEEYEALKSQQIMLELDEKVKERNIAKWQAEIPTLREKIATSASMQVQFENILKTIEDSLKQNEETIQARKDTLIELDVQVCDLENQIEEITPKLMRLIPTQSLVIEKGGLTNKIQSHLATIARNEVIRRKNIETKLREEENKKALADLNKKQNDLLLSTNNYSEAKHILEVDLPNYIIVKACSKLEKHINHFIAEVKPGMIVRLFQARTGVEFYYSPTMDVENPDDWMSTKMASGFEKEVLSAAWRVALARAYNLKVLMLDEADSAASSVSSEKMFREIANLIGFDQLFIVTQKPEVVDVLVQENDHVTSFYVKDGTFTRQEY